MTTPDPTGTSTAADRFLALIRPKPRDRARTVEDADYVLMLLRMVRALEARSIDNPAVLPDVLAVAQRLNEVVNVTIAANAERYAVNPMLGASRNECARVLGITPQSAGERKKIGERIIAQRLADAGATKFSEAKREKEIVKRATDHAVVSMADFLARRAS